MSTINEEIALELLNNNGCYPGDPQAYAILKYLNRWIGDVSWAVVYSQQDLARYYTSEGVNHPQIIWPIGAPSNFGQFVEWREKNVN